ncbi:Protein of unknown function [Sphingomonas laterariae]|uniref:DUF1592 domain-containing protein n=2 Tax=Edaphosphingomonas laterariae TaxID=861865 RepID=A0A239DFU1_9SPHN|nr:Protein of unknown function [Sphingomonas laterariae]
MKGTFTMKTGRGIAILLAAAATVPLVLAGADRPSIAAVPASHADEASTVRRITEPQYRRAITDIFGADIKVVGRFEPDLRVDGLLAVGTSAVSITSGGLEQYETIARNIAEQVVAPDHRASLIGCTPAAADPAGSACAGQVFDRLGLRMLRRPLAPAERAALVATTLESARALGDFHAGLAAALTGLLTSPDFLFRIDRPGAPEQGRRMVDGWSKASRLSFFLWNAPPDEMLLAAAAKGELDRPEARARLVATMIASPRFADGVRAFFSDFLHLDDIDLLAKDARIYPAFSSAVAADAREQTLRTITDLLVDRQGDYRDLFTTRRIAMNRTLGPLYDVPVAERGWTFHQFPDGDPRAGLFTQISFLAQHSHPGRTSPTLRGKAIQEILLCETIPAPPANVNFAVVQDVDNPTLKTTRARLQAHLDDEECASCHKLTDPMGLALEKFDGAGQFRTTEHGEAIDTTGSFADTHFDGAAALGRLFQRNPQPIDCLVQSTWRYAMGRRLAAFDKPVVARLNADFAGTGYRMVDLIRAIALSPQFYEYEPASPPARMAGWPALATKGAM